MMLIEAAKRPLMQSQACGDQCDFWPSGQGWLLGMADGLGHGEHAETAAKAALAYVGAHLDEALPTLFAGCDRALRPTRGAAMSLVRIDPDGSLEQAGIGNTQVRIHRVRGKHQRLSGNHGIVGGGYRQLHLHSDRLQPGDLLILHTDGISDKFDLSAYGSLLLNPSLLAYRLLADWGKALDDAAVMVCRYGVP